MVIAGGTGALGRRLAGEAADRGDDVVILTRSPRTDIAHRQVRWDGHTVGDWATELAGAILVNLAGELVDLRPTPSNIALLRRSRVDPTRALVAAASEMADAPSLWLQMSTAAIYGDGGQDIIDETHPIADGPLQMAGVARPWEDAVRGGVVTDRLVVLRTGVVLDRGTPAFDRLARLTKLGLGGRISTGDQWISWIHATDFLRAVAFIRDHHDLDGVVHVTAPNPIQNRDMMSTLRRSLRRPWSPPTPKPFVHVGAMLMRTDPALALTGRRCVPHRLTQAGFDFEYPNFSGAIAELTNRTLV